MLTLSTFQAVENLLGKIKERINSDGLVVMNGRTINQQTLAALDITPDKQWEIINSIKPEDYCGGPEPDNKYPEKYVAVFGKHYKGIEIYIKFSVGMPGTPVVCLSFHEWAGSLPYQFK